MELYTLTVKELIEYRQKALDEDNMELFMEIESVFLFVLFLFN